MSAPYQTPQRRGARLASLGCPGGVVGLGLAPNRISHRQGGGMRKGQIGWWGVVITGGWGYIAAEMLLDMGVKKVRLMTNNSNFNY